MIKYVQEEVKKMGGNPEKVIELNLANKGINKICGLDLLVNLKKLDLQNNHIKKIENLDKSINLQELDLKDNYITNIENLNMLKKLTVLSVFPQNKPI